MWRGAMNKIVKFHCVICKKPIPLGKEINQKEKIWKGQSKYSGGREIEIARIRGGTYCRKCWKKTKMAKVFLFSLIWGWALFVMGALLWWCFFGKST